MQSSGPGSSKKRDIEEIEETVTFFDLFSSDMPDDPLANAIKEDAYPNAYQLYYSPLSDDDEDNDEDGDEDDEGDAEEDDE